MTEQTQPRTRVQSVMEDPQTGAIARVYAQALLAAVPPDQMDDLLEEFGSFLEDVLARNPDFARILASGVAGRDDKLSLIERVVTGRASTLFASFLKVLAHHERLDLLPLIFRQARLQYERASGKGRVQVTTAHALDAEQLQAITRRLTELLPFAPIIEHAIDPALIGGMRIRVGDTVYDGSLRLRLRQLRERVRERSLHEIQSGRDRFSHQE
jgi:F-type H+-transporting ATPase subunit delta